MMIIFKLPLFYLTVSPKCKSDACYFIREYHYNYSISVVVMVVNLLPSDGVCVVCVCVCVHIYICDVGVYRDQRLKPGVFLSRS